MTIRVATPFHNYVDQAYVRASNGAGRTHTQRHWFTVEERTLTFDFYPHYHPYAPELTRRLIRRQVPGLLAADTEYVKDEDGQTVMLPSGKPLPELYREVFSAEDYQPAEVVDQRPVEDLDFTPAGPYSVYNWELFFHVPLTIAIHLSRNARYADAQRWLHFVF